MYNLPRWGTAGALVSWGNGMVNIGQRIKEELQRQERTVSWMARKLNCTRAAVYRIFDKNSIDTALLATISEVLHYDFFQELSQDVRKGVAEL